jgi:uncharacterized membrane protein YeaQ/YmgE (transglycosylase-associated protein family)
VDKWKAILDRARSLSFVGLMAGFFIGYVGQFVAGFVTTLLFISETHSDIWQTGQESQNYLRIAVSILLQVVFLAIAGFVATMLSGRSETDTGIATGVLCMLAALFDVVGLMTSHSVTVTHADIITHWGLIICSIPAAWFGARKYLGS